MSKETQERAAKQVQHTLEALTDQVVLLGEVLDRIQSRSNQEVEYQMAEAVIGKTVGHATVARQAFKELAGLLLGMSELADKLGEDEGLSVDRAIREYSENMGQVDWGELFPDLKGAVVRLNLELEALQGTAPGEVGYA